MGIVATVRNDEGICGEVGSGKIRGEFGKGDQILRLRGSVLHIGHVRERVVANQVFSGVTSGVARVREVLGIRLPGFAGCEEFADDVVIRYWKGPRGLRIVNGEGFASGK